MECDVVPAPVVHAAALGLAWLDRGCVAVVALAGAPGRRRVSTDADPLEPTHPLDCRPVLSRCHAVKASSLSPCPSHRFPLPDSKFLLTGSLSPLRGLAAPARNANRPRQCPITYCMYIQYSTVRDSRLTRPGASIAQGWRPCGRAPLRRPDMPFGQMMGWMYSINPSQLRCSWADDLDGASSASPEWGGGTVHGQLTHSKPQPQLQLQLQLQLHGRICRRCHRYLCAIDASCPPNFLPPSAPESSRSCAAPWLPSERRPVWSSTWCRLAPGDASVPVAGSQRHAPTHTLSPPDWMTEGSDH
nr:hypothetical protein CFP56_11743 [Quercus suber]